MSLADLPSLNYCQATIGNQNIHPKTFFSDKVAPPTPIKPKYCQEASKTEFTTLTAPPHVILFFLLGEVEIDALLLQLKFKGCQK